MRLPSIGIAVSKLENLSNWNPLPHSRAATAFARQNRCMGTAKLKWSTIRPSATDAAMRPARNFCNRDGGLGGYFGNKPYCWQISLPALARLMAEHHLPVPKETWINHWELMAAFLNEFWSGKLLRGKKSINYIDNTNAMAWLNKGTGNGGPTLYWHNEGAVIGFYDGHAERLAKEKVWIAKNFTSNPKQPGMWVAVPEVWNKNR